MVGRDLIDSREGTEGRGGRRRRHGNARRCLGGRRGGLRACPGGGGVKVTCWLTFQGMRENFRAAAGVVAASVVAGLGQF